MGRRSTGSRGKLNPKRGRFDMGPSSEDSEPPPSSDSHDSFEDETYEIDATNLQSDEEKIEYDTRAKGKGKGTLQEEGDEEASVDGDLDNAIDFGEEDDTGVESDDSVECGDRIREELQYDVEELILIRKMNRNLRRAQQTSVAPFAASQVYKEAHTIFSATEQSRSVGKTVPSWEWPLYWTTCESRNQSDHRDSDDDEDEDSQVGHEAEKTKKGKKKLDYPFFNEETDMGNVYFETGLRFQSREVLKKAILWYSIQQKKDIRCYENNQRMIFKLRCHDCDWKMSAGRDLEHKDAWQIKTLSGEHRCARAFAIKLISERWLTEQSLDKILRYPKITCTEIKDGIQSRYGISVNIHMCTGAKSNALSAVTNLMKRQYGILKLYLQELRISNPGTRCVLKTSEAPPGQPAIFQRCYVCFDALRKGFVETCRPIIGVDGCSLKHACGGKLLCAVGRDGNNHMYPVAWAVVKVECRSSWEWFLKLVGEDLNIGSGGGWTVISNPKRWLVESIHALWPNIEHRRCARHIFSDWIKLHKGRELEQQFWRCVKATTKEKFTAEIDDLKKLSKDAHDDFMGQDPTTFCKSHFRTHSKCDVVDNMAETFNSFILLARYKPIVTMFEDIRLALMDRMKEKKENVSKFVVGVAPGTSEKLEEARDEQKNCECRWNGGDNESGFEVLHKGIIHEVDLEKRTCSCRVWELTGIPCCHAMSAVLYIKKNPEDYIAMWYRVETYAQTYSNLIQPARCNISWDHGDEAGVVLPPNIEGRGRRRRKTSRRRDADVCSIKTNPFKIKRGNPSSNQSWSHDSESTAMKRAEDFQPKLSAEHPSFIKCIIHSHTKRCGWLALPSKFCHEHLPKRDANLELVDKSGNTYSVKYVGGRNMLTSGWNNFCSSHNLDKGDVLVGQLVNKASFQVDIHIIRHNVVAETNVDLGPLESDNCADVTISNDGEKHSNTFAKAQEKQHRVLSSSPSNILEDPDYVPPGLCTDKVLKHCSSKMRMRSSKYAQQEPYKQSELIKGQYGGTNPHEVTGMNSDPVSSQATIDKTPTSKHRSCKVQPRTCQESTRKHSKLIGNEYGTANCHRTRLTRRRRFNPSLLQSTNTNSDPSLLRGIEMCSIRFGYHLERIWMSYPADKLADFAYFECLWFQMHRETCHGARVLSWIKKKNIFSRKYTFVPICIWGHWNLLILCHFGERLGSENKKPFMLLLDSLYVADPMRYGPEIRKFVKDIFKEEGISDKSVSKIPLKVPKVPQQKDKECGHFTLYFIKKFLDATLETVADGDLTFIDQNWFSHEEMDGFCYALDEESKALELLRSQEMALDESLTDGDVICLD